MIEYLRKDFSEVENGVLEDYFQKGTLVKLIDGSYMTNENGEHVFAAYHGTEGHDHIYQVIDGNKPFPTAANESCGSYSYWNNMKIRSINTGLTYHCSKINIRSVEGARKVIYKGKEISITTIIENSEFGEIF